jgi:hypothetical protein
MNFTKQEFDAFRKDVEKALAEVAKWYFLDIKVGGISYTSNDFTAKMTCTKTDVNAEKDNYELYCKMYGFSKDDYRKPFIFEDGRDIH